MRRRWRLYRPAEPRRGLFTAAVLLGLYTALVFVGVAFCRDSATNSAFWPANGVAVAALLVLPRRLGLVFSAVCLAINVVENALGNLDVDLNILYSGLNTALTFATAFLTRTFCGAATDLSRVKRLMQFSIVAFGAAVGEATIGDIYRGVTENGFDTRDWYMWFLCDALGLILATPAVLLAVKAKRAVYACDAGPFERWALLGLNLAVTVLAFSQAHSVLFLMIYPLLILTAFRAGPPWVSASVMTVAIPAIAFTVRGYGPIAVFAPVRPFVDQDLLQLFLVSIFVCALPATNALGERNRNAQRLERSHAAARAARAQAERAAAAKTRFLAVMSHEIRTPLNGVIGFTRSLHERTDLAGDVRRQLGLILSSSDILLSLVNDILDFSKIEAHQVDLNLAPVELDKLVEETASLVRPIAEGKGLALMVTTRSEQGVAHMVDDLRFRQILLNLLNNAVKFTAQGSVEVVLECERPDEAHGDAVLVRVLDTGIGVPKDKLERLFKPFSQGDASITRIYGGTGLGLAISRSLVEMMGGEIGVKSRAGRGSEFWFRVPLALAATAEAHEVSHAASDLDQAVRILVVDDHPINREVAQLLLTAAGCEVSTCDNGVAAVEAARIGGIDLILMDIHMPVMDGFAASRAIRALPGEASRIPIVAMTADVTSRDVALCRDAGMDGHVGKPIDRKALLETISSLLNAPRDSSGASAAA